MGSKNVVPNDSLNHGWKLLYYQPFLVIGCAKHNFLPRLAEFFIGRHRFIARIESPNLLCSNNINSTFGKLFTFVIQEKQKIRRKSLADLCESLFFHKCPAFNRRALPLRGPTVMRLYQSACTKSAWRAASSSAPKTALSE